jgi:hypothetical protein
MSIRRLVKLFSELKPVYILLGGVMGKNSQPRVVNVYSNLSEVWKSQETYDYIVVGFRKKT